MLNDHVKKEAAPKWRILGKQLLKDALLQKLNVIEDTYHDDVQRCCTEVFEYWIENFEATWNKMIDALNKMDQTNLATTIDQNVYLKGVFIIYIVIYVLIREDCN